MRLCPHSGIDWTTGASLSSEREVGPAPPQEAFAIRETANVAAASQAWALMSRLYERSGIPHLCEVFDPTITQSASHPRAAGTHGRQ
jgi:hypothetical protein